MAVTAITGYSCRLVTVGNQNCGNTMSTQEAYTERQWTKEETDLLPFGYKPNKILIADSDPDTIIYNATWYNDPVLACFRSYLTLGPY
jgi:hypothetical protein